MVRIKICGITNVADAQAAVEAGADFLGLNFYEKSPRHITPAEAAKIRPHIPAGVQAVGVFVNANPSGITDLCASLSLDAVQLHGDETPATVDELSRHFSVIKAFRVNTTFPLDQLNSFPEAFAFLLDADHAGQYGGTGHTADWDVARRAALTHRIILAGGLKVQNIADAIRSVRPYAVDVASGVESEPGKKDHARLSEFVQEVRRAEKQLEALSEIRPQS